MENKVVKKIVSARITPLPKELTDPMPEVWVVLEGDSDEQRLFSFYPDEIQFKSDEFVGLTLDEGRELKRHKDALYLTS